MKLLLLTNMPAYHQMDLADAFNAALPEGNFRMGIYAPLSEERVEMNWQDSYQADYIIRFSESPAARAKLLEWIAEADVVIQGRFPIRYLRKRIAGGGLTLAHQERIWKKGFTLGRFLRRLPHLYKNYWSVNQPNYHLLAASAYASRDLTELGVFKNRCWKFGYFIKTRPLQNKPLANKLSIIWCARMIDCKQPDVALEFAKGLKQGGIDFQLTMIGDGELFDQTRTNIQKLQLEDVVQLKGWLSLAAVNASMAGADIMLMTSDQREGWGLVINEAINNICFVVANTSAGAANWLIENGTNGLVYQDRELQTAIKQLVELCHDKTKIFNMAQLAYNDLQAVWSSTAAADRTIQLAHLLLGAEAEQKKAQELFKSGPGSPA